MHNSDTIYCSLDLEMTGFDPERDEILEVGFVLFRITARGPEVLERYGQVFRPEQEVAVKILALTGIRETEIADAPRFAEYRDFISQKIAGSVIVGHSIMTDIRFLEAHGVGVPPAQSIDTLELAQWILPTHHSYNLENLIHFLHARHPGAHRALADAEATMHVLIELFRVYRGFPEQLQARILFLLDRYPDFFIWRPLLDIVFSGVVLGGDQRRVQQSVQRSAQEICEGQIVHYSSTDRQGALSALAEHAQVTGRNVLILLGRETDVLKLWKHHGFSPLFPDDRRFNPEKLERLYLKDDLTRDQVVFLLKVLVWQALNWQTETTHDLNVSFFGNQYLSSVLGGGDRDLPVDSKILCATYETYVDLPQKDLFTERLLICHELKDLEVFLTANVDDRVSWGYINVVLKSIYNPETLFGDVAYRDIVVETLLATDLFFAILAIAVRKFVDADGYADWDVLVALPFGFERLVRAMEVFAGKLEYVARACGKEELALAASALRSFFIETPERVKWLEFHNDRISLRNQALNVISERERLFHIYEYVSYTNTLSTEKELAYYQTRLGLRGLETIDFRSYTDRHGIKLEKYEKPADDDILLSLTADAVMPVVIVFDSVTAMKSFYDTHYEDLKSRAAVYAQLYAGGGTKILRNFNLQENSVLMATTDFLLRHRSKQIQPKTVVFRNFIGEQKFSPYERALAHWLSKSGFEYDLSVLQRLYDLESIYQMSCRNLESIVLYGLPDKSVENGLINSAW